MTDCTVGEPLPNYAASGNYHTSAPIPVVAGQTYSVVGCGGLNGSFLYLDKDMNYLDGFANASYSSRTFTVPNNLSIAYLRFPFSTATVDTCQLELGSTASAYTPYNPSSRSIAINIGQTVYSGTVDVVTGVVTVTHKIVDLGSLTWTFSNTWGQGNTGDVFYSNLITDAVSTNADVTIMCSMYMPVTADWLYAHNTTDCIIALPATTRLYIRDFSTQDADAFKTKVTGQTVHYPLATPIPIQLTPQEVESLAGDNTVWSTANGDLTVEYRSN